MPYQTASAHGKSDSHLDSTHFSDRWASCRCIQSNASDWSCLSVRHICLLGRGTNTSTLRWRVLHQEYSRIDLFLELHSQNCRHSYRVQQQIASPFSLAEAQPVAARADPRSFPPHRLWGPILAPVLLVAIAIIRLSVQPCFHPVRHTLFVQRFFDFYFKINNNS